MTTTLALAPTHQGFQLSNAELEEIKTEAGKARAIAALAAKFEITNDQQEAEANAYFQATHERIALAEERRQRIVRPMLDAKQETDKLFKEITTPLEVAKGALSRILGSYRAKVAAAKQAQLKAMEAAQAVPGPASTPEAARALVISGTESATTLAGTRDALEVEIEIGNAAAVPRQFCVPSDKLIKAYALECHKLGTIPAVAGVTIRLIPKVVPTGR